MATATVIMTGFVSARIAISDVARVDGNRVITPLKRRWPDLFPPCRGRTLTQML
jgi:hypothetical protein